MKNTIPTVKKELKNFTRTLFQVTSGFILVIISAIAFSASLDYADKSRATANCPAPLQSCVDTTMPNQSGKTFNVSSTKDFQQALIDAKFGDTIILSTGQTYTGPFTLSKKPGNGWIVIRSSQLNSLPSEGVRVLPADASRMPKIITDDAEPAIRAADGAHHYRFTGVEVASENKKTSITTTNLVLLGDGSQNANEVPHHIVFDRSYIHGNPSGNLRRAFAFNGRHLAVIDSYVSEAHEIGADSQAIGGWSGDGPFKIVNNYLEGAGENVLFGGSKAQSGLDPADLEFRKNYLSKPLSWRGSKWSIKNILEFKNMRRAFVHDNIFENNWSAAQTGTAILFTPKSSGGPNVAVNDITFTNNIVRHVSSGFQIMGTDYTDDRYPKQGVQVNRINISNNIFEDISRDKWGGGGRFILITSGPGPNDLTIDNNTVTGASTALIFDTEQKKTIKNFKFTNNVIHKTKDVVTGRGTAPGISSLTEYLGTDYVFTGNTLDGAKSSLYPANNKFSSAGNVTPSPTPHTTPTSPSTGGGQVSGSIITHSESSAAVNTPSVYSDGSLIFDDNTIYVMEYGRKRPFVTMDVFTGLGFKLSSVVSIEASNIPEGPGVFTKDTRHPRGVLVNDRGVIYFMGDVQRYGFPSAEIFHSWGNEFQDVVSANPLDRQIPEGSVVQLK